MKSLNIVFPGPGSVELREAPVRQVGPGQVLCAARTSLISIGTETRCLRGDFEPDTSWAAWVRYPFNHAYSMVAEVIGVGDSVAVLQPGDRVAVSTPHRQYIVADAGDLWRIPDAVSDEDATWVFLGCTTQLAVRRA